MSHLQDKPDWPDRGQWERDFTAQMLHDVPGHFRDLLPWNHAESKDLMDQVRAGVDIVEIARRHQRHVATVECMRRAVLYALEESLMR